MYSRTHQTKFVVNPPSMITMYLGSPDQISEVPAWMEEALIGAPQVMANAKQALIIPENVATRMPLVKLNSAIAFIFSASGISLSLVKPANAAMPMPSRQTATPARVTWPGRSEERRVGKE